MRTSRILFAVALAILPGAAAADAEVHEWVGTYDMNHDGHVGVLRIRDSKIDCAGSAWCAYVLDYVGKDGARRAGSIQVVDDHNQHMTFFVEFPDNRQKFDAYLFSWDKGHMAGTTVWGGRTFGFYATRKP